MRRHFTAIALTLTLTGVAAADRYFAEITAVDAEKGAIVFKPTRGKDANKEMTARLAKDCIIKEGLYRLGKPARTDLGPDIAEGLKNKVFKTATAENPLRVNVFTADVDDPGKNINRGDVTHILVNPKKDTKTKNK
jgi:hypothetical protein